MDINDIGACQRALGPLPIGPRTRNQYRILARWWELEAKRGYRSSSDSLRYAANMRRAAALTEFLGPGTWLELQDRAAEAQERAKRIRDGRLAIVREKRTRRLKGRNLNAVQGGKRTS